MYIKFFYRPQKNVLHNSVTKRQLLVLCLCIDSVRYYKSQSTEMEYYKPLIMKL